MPGRLMVNNVPGAHHLPLLGRCAVYHRRPELTDEKSAFSAGGRRTPTAAGMSLPGSPPRRIRARPRRFCRWEAVQKRRGRARRIVRSRPAAPDRRRGRRFCGRVHSGWAELGPTALHDSDVAVCAAVATAAAR